MAKDLETRRTLWRVSDAAGKGKDWPIGHARLRDDFDVVEGELGVAGRVAGEVQRAEVAGGDVGLRQGEPACSSWFVNTAEISALAL